MRYSGIRVLREGLRGNRGWRPAWVRPEPREAYDIIIIGGGGHGLSTAYHLAKEHGLRNIAVLEKGYLGSGNIGRNTTIVRANYMLPGNSEFYSFSLRLWESLESTLNYNVMHSQRGLINLFHSDGQRDAFVRRGNAMINQGDDAILLDPEGVRRHLPYLDFENIRFPIYGGLLHPRGGTARHDAVAWGYARAASRLGVHLIENCEVTGIDTAGGKVTGVQTSRGAIRAKKVAMVVAGRSGQVAAMGKVQLTAQQRIADALPVVDVRPDQQRAGPAYQDHQGMMAVADAGQRRAQQHGQPGGAERSDQARKAQRRGGNGAGGRHLRQAHGGQPFVAHAQQRPHQAERRRQAQPNQERHAEQGIEQQPVVHLPTSTMRVQ